jgi:hypothetical protein
MQYATSTLRGWCRMGPAAGTAELPSFAVGEQKKQKNAKFHTKKTQKMSLQCLRETKGDHFYEAG